MTDGQFRILGLGTSIFDPTYRQNNDYCLDKLRKNGVEAAVGKTGKDTFGVTGIRYRYLSPKSTHELGSEALTAAINNAVARTNGRFAAADISVLFSTSSSLDLAFPGSAARHQSEQGMPDHKVEVADILNACAGWIYSVSLLESRLRDIARMNAKKGIYKKLYGAAVGEESIGKTMNEWDSMDCCLWGTGAGAGIFEFDPEGDPNYGFICSTIRSDGSKSKITRSINVGTFRDPTYQGMKPWMLGGGSSVYRYCREQFVPALHKFISEVGVKSRRRLKLVIHNANDRMWDELLPKLGLSKKNIFTTTRKYGNLSTASIPVTLTEVCDQLNPGDEVVLAAPAGGMVYSLAYLRWI